MFIKYYGQMKHIDIKRQNTRCAVIAWNERDKTEERLADRIVDLAIKVTPWKKIDGYSGCYYVAVADKDDYDEFLAWYKEAKKMFINCMKHGF